MVPVYVREGGRPVRALAADDFMLADSGVSQTVSAIDVSSIPLDVSLVVENTEAAEYHQGPLPERHRGHSRPLAPDDRLRLVAAASDVIEVLPLTACRGRGSAELPAATTYNASMTQSRRSREIAVPGAST